MRPLFLFLLSTLTGWAWAQPAVHYQVYALKFADMGVAAPLSMWVDQAPQNDSVHIDFSIWLMKGDNGRNVLLDAGFQPDMVDSPDAKEFAIVNYQRPDSVLHKVGLKAEDITDIILSHPHWDHCDGIGLFPNAHVWVQKDDYDYFVGAAWQQGGENGGFYRRDVRRLVDLNIAGRVTLVDGDDKEIIPGIKVFTGSRHTFNSQFALVQQASHPVILASDNIWVYYNLEHLLPASKGGTFDPAGYVRSMVRMKTLAGDPRYIVPGHDARVYAIFPKVADGVVRIDGAMAAVVQPMSMTKDTGMLKNRRHYMRIARIVVDPAQLNEYCAALREGMQAAVRKEPGVLNLWAVAEKNNPTHLTVFEIYADVDAYHAHIQTAHFKKYKATVQKMVKSLELVDVDPVALESKGKL